MSGKKKGFTVLVTGATGRQGGSVVQALLKRGYQVRAFTRDPESPAAMSLQELGLEMVMGDFNDPASIEQAAKQVDAVFIMTTMMAGLEAETQHGINAVDAAKAAGVKHVVLTSVASANQQTGIPHFDSKYAVEQYLASAEVPYTIIAPVAFMENATTFMLPMLRSGVLQGVPPERPQQQIAVADIGGMAAAVMERKDECLGGRFDIASEAVTGIQMADILTRVTGRDIVYEEMSEEENQRMGGNYAKMLELYSVDIPALHEQFPEVGWHTFESWAAEQDWTTLLGSD